MSYISFDIGKARTGVAVSDSGTLTTPIGVIRGSLEQQIEQCILLIEDRAAKVVVVGQPRPNQAFQAEFIARLRELLAQHHWSGKVVAIDETLTTKEAERLLRDAGRPATDSDVVAAQLILEDYLSNNHTGDERHAK